MQKNKLEHHAKGLTRREMLLTIGAGAAAYGAVTPSLSWAASTDVKTILPGSLTVALTGDMPMTSVSNGKIVGTDGEMIGLIADRLGLKVVPALMDWPSCIESVRSGRADMTLGNMGWTAARAAAMQLTDAVYFTGKFTLMRKDMKVSDKLSLDDLRGHSLGTVTAFSIVPELKQVPGTTEVKLYDNTDACVRDVMAGRLDFAFLDTPTVGYMLKQNPGWDLKLVPTAPFPGFKSLGQKQTSVFGINGANTDLFDAINGGIKWLWRSGANRTILAKYGMENADYLVATTPNARIGVDRDENGNVIGPFSHPARDFAQSFAG